MTKFKLNDTVRVQDPADRRKRLDGTIVRVDEGRGALSYLVKVEIDDYTELWGCYEGELRRR
jgi:hypothetical protein